MHRKSDLNLKPATHVTETGTRNWYQLSSTRHLHVCRSTWYQIFLVPDSGTQLSTLMMEWNNDEISKRIDFVEKNHLCMILPMRLQHR